MPRTPVKGEDEVRRILEAACLNRELLILATLREKYESHFIHLDDGALHVAPTMSGEAVAFELRSEVLSLRFPAGSRFLEGRTRLLGHGMAEGRRTLRLAVPALLQDDELRRGHRVTRTGRVEVSYHTKRYDLRSAQLADISTGGLRIVAPGRDLREELDPGDKIAFTVPLDASLHLEAKAAARWVAARSAGFEFSPALDPATLAALARWIFQRREEERDAALSLARGQASGREGGELVLVSGDPDLEAAMREALSGLGPLARVAATPQGLKEALARAPGAVLLHAPGAGLDERRRLKALAELLGARCPAVLVGTGLESAQLFALGRELKLAPVFGFRPNVAPLFHRLVRGLLRRREDSPSPAQEPFSKE
jgi:hypothetical protein